MSNKPISPNDVDAILKQMHSHYKVPTSLIINRLNTLATQLDYDERHNDVEEINAITKTCYTMLRTSTNVTTYYNLIEPTSPLKPCKTHMNTFLTNLFTQISAAFVDTKHYFEFEICKEVIITEFDPDYLSLAIFHLISNACVFSPIESTVKATIATNNNTVYITISDEGDGIPKDIFNNIFTPFYTHEYQPQPEVERGIGLGLPIVKQIATLMNGNVIVAAGSFGGTKITISFPIVNSTPGILTVNASTATYATKRFSQLHVQLSSIFNFSYN